MIDRPARDRAALALRRFTANRITNEEFLDSYPTSASDPAVRAIDSRAWALYDDFREHRLDASRELRREIARWVVFLHSDVEYRWPPFQFIMVQPPRWLDWLSGGRLSRRQDEAFARFCAAADFSVWPFHSGEELADAVARPRFLAGDRTSAAPRRTWRCS
jgi:hypothetical protein